MVRSNAQRGIWFDMDTHLMRLRNTVGETDPAIVGLTGTYHALLRQWAAWVLRKYCVCCETSSRSRWRCADVPR